MEQLHRHTHHFTFQNHLIRTTQRDNKTWFVNADICQALGIADSREALDHLTPEEKNVIEGREFNDKNMLLSIITEHGLEKLIYLADDPSANGFSNWMAASRLSDIDNQNPGITENVLSRVHALHLKALGKSNFQAIMDTMRLLRDDHPKEYDKAMRYIDCTHDFLFDSMQEAHI